MILDVLAHNTYITSYNANMVANEVFIDSATKKMWSFSKKYWLYAKTRSCSATITFFINTVIFHLHQQLLLSKGVVASSSSSFVTIIRFFYFRGYWFLLLIIPHNLTISDLWRKFSHFSFLTTPELNRSYFG